jgi:hypothetical protein
VALAGFHDDVATLAAIAPRRAPTWDELLPAKRKAAVAAVASFDSDYGLIDKHQWILRVTIPLSEMLETFPEFRPA